MRLRGMADIATGLVLVVAVGCTGGSDGDAARPEASTAVRALRSSGRSEIDGDRIGLLGLLGRPMGGGVVYNTLVVAPGLVDAAVVFAPVS